MWPRTMPRLKVQVRTTKLDAIVCRTIPNGKLDVIRDAGAWMRDDNGVVTKAFRHICWDGCMFPNDVMMRQETWNKILRPWPKCETRMGGTDGTKLIQKPTGFAHRPGGLRLHGPHSFQCVSSSAALFRSAL